MSVNLCADQMLLRLANPSSITALGPFARDPLMSFLAEPAQTFPQVSNRTETLLHIEADAVIVGPFDNMYMRAALRRRNIKEIVVGRWVSLSEVRRGIEFFSNAINEAAAGSRLIEEIDIAAADLRGLLKSDRPKTFLLLHRRGYVGEGEIVTELLEMAGLVDAAKGAAAQFMSVESVVALRPSVLVVSGRSLKAEDRGLELLEHPALTRLYPPSRRITTPDRLTICGGPSTPALIRHLKSELMEWARRQ
ncbi:MAG: hypothetical protein Q8M31_20485 [Beijerinckiaceae bacterium]|nr:hypothetical protein [Beijerinckiaceae bacterium]